MVKTKQNLSKKAQNDKFEVFFLVLNFFLGRCCKKKKLKQQQHVTKKKQKTTPHKKNASKVREFAIKSQKMS